jgi:hypothetical protein
MQQLSIFDSPDASRARPRDPPRARREDPASSQLAAARVDEFAAAHYRRILEAMPEPSTIYEIADRAGISHIQVARRLPEMDGTRVRVKPGLHRKGPTGRMCRVWERI